MPMIEKCVFSETVKVPRREGDQYDTLKTRVLRLSLDRSIHVSTRYVSDTVTFIFLENEKNYFMFFSSR